MLYKSLAAIALAAQVAAVEITGKGLVVPNGEQFPAMVDGTTVGVTCVGLSDPITSTFTIRNDKSEAVEVSGFFFAEIDQTEANTFSISIGETNIVLQPEDTVDFGVDFKPFTAGVKNAILTIALSDNSNYEFAVGGRGVLPQVEVHPSDDPERPVEMVDLGEFQEASMTKSIMITNLADCEAKVTEVFVEAVQKNGSPSSAFTVSSVSLPFTLQYDESENADIMFTPEGEGIYTATLVVRAEGVPDWIVSLTAEVVPPPQPVYPACVSTPKEQFEDGIIVSVVPAVEGDLYMVDKSQFPCTVGGWAVATTNTSSDGFSNFDTAQGMGVYPFGATMVGEPLRYELSAFPHPFKDVEDGSIRTMRWAPRQSCAVRGCRLAEWTDVGEPYVIDGVDYFPPANASGVVDDGSECYCDDACTRYKDCCWDYTWTCQARHGNVDTIADGQVSFALNKMTAKHLTNGNILEALY